MTVTGNSLECTYSKRSLVSPLHPGHLTCPVSLVFICVKQLSIVLGRVAPSLSVW